MYPSLAMPSVNPGNVLNLLFWAISSHLGVHSSHSTTSIPLWVWVTLPSFARTTIGDAPGGVVRDNAALRNGGLD